MVQAVVEIGWSSLQQSTIFSSLDCSKQYSNPSCVKQHTHYTIHSLLMQCISIPVHQHRVPCDWVLDTVWTQQTRQRDLFLEHLDIEERYADYWAQHSLSDLPWFRSFLESSSSNYGRRSQRTCMCRYTQCNGLTSCGIGLHSTFTAPDSKSTSSNWPPSQPM